MVYGDILQITPAQSGWEAVYAQRYKNKQSGASFHKKPLNCWAVVAVGIEGGQGFGTAVVGMVVSDNKSSPALDFANGDVAFIGYDYPGCEVNWHFEAESWRKLGRS